MTTIRTLQAVVIVAAAMISSKAMAHGDQGVGNTSSPKVQPCTVLYTSAAYSHAIHGSPNPAPEVVIGRVATVYVSQLCHEHAGYLPQAVLDWIACHRNHASDVRPHD